MPRIIVISGANGAGKSTLAPYLLRDAFKITEYINADTIALGLSAFAPEHAALAAGRVMLKRMRELGADGKDFAFETTLASRTYAGWLRRLQAHGYAINLIFLWLKDSNLAVARVNERVKAGGHNVPEAVIRRRYGKGLRNLFELYQPFVDSWVVYDCSDADNLLLVASKDNQKEIQIFEAQIWEQIKATTSRST